MTDDTPFIVMSAPNGARRGKADHPRIPLSPQEHAENAKAIDNSWFLEHRVLLGPGASSDALQFLNDVVLVQPIAGSSHIVESGIAHSFKGSPGAFSWHPAGSGFRTRS